MTTEPTVPALLDVASIHAAVAAGLPPTAIVAAVHDRIEAADDPGIFIHLRDREETLAAAAALPPFDPDRYPLWGVPFAIKDNIDRAGWPTTCGCPDFSHIPDATATAVARLEAAGAILIGKTNLDQFATGLVGVRTPYPVPRNAFDAEIVPGGSSSGSAVAVARGLVAFSLGTDTAGSGRVPAALNSVVGLKPSRGLVPNTGVFPACRSLDCVSIFAPAVGDAVTVLAVMAGPEPADPWSRPFPTPTLAALAPGIRVGIPDRASRVFAGDRDAERAFDAAVADIADTGSEAVTLDLSAFLEAGRLLYEGPWVAERYHALREVMEHRPAILHPVTRRIVEQASGYTATDTFEAIYRLVALRRSAETAWRQVDALMVPSLPRPRTLADLSADPVGANSELGVYTNFVNLLDLAAIAVPGRFRQDGLPAGVTVIAPAGEDSRLAALADRLHRAAGVPAGATGLPLPAAATPPDRAADGEVELAVVGAHLSGQPLNGALRAAGGRYLRQVATAPVYRLYALAGEPPRPGLLRTTEAGAGVSIETEVWALPPAGLGRLMTEVSPPLSIGTADLADGTSPKCFLVEAAGTKGAKDISDSGGWRAHLAAIGASV
ncbi:MAG: allophanate hydrolase [Azospirillaceae bacterium]